MRPNPARGDPDPSERQPPFDRPWLAKALVGVSGALVLTEEVAILRRASVPIKLLSAALFAVSLTILVHRYVLPCARAQYTAVNKTPSPRWVLGCVALAGVLVVVFPTRAPALVALAQIVCLSILVYALAPRVIHGWPSQETPVRPWEGLGHALVPVGVWIAWLIVFFPGILSSDSADQWAQAGQAQLHDFHPIVHTALIRILRSVWDSPAVVSLTQILGLGLAVGWGLRELRLSGLSRAGAWCTASLLAVLPVFATMAITLWKDVPFGVTLLGLTVALFRIAAGRPLRFLHWGLLVGLAGLAMVLRHNGAPVVLGVMAALALLLPKGQRWASVAVGLAAVVLGLGVRQAVLRTYPVTSFTPEIALVGILGSHVAHGTSMTPRERAILDDLHPVESKWAYRCFSNVPTLWGSGQFDWEALRRHAPSLRRIAVDLTLRDPRPSYSHVRCASSMIWEIHPPGAPLTAVGFNIYPDGSLSTIAPAKGVPLASPPSKPALRLAAGFVQETLRPELAWVIWRPALALWLLLLGCLATCLRSRTWRPFAILLPLLIHTAALILVITAPDVRYQYGALLIAGVFGIGFFAGVRVGTSPGAAAGPLTEHGSLPGPRRDPDRLSA